MALKQWGSSEITRNGQVYDEAYTPKAMSITGWGQFPTPGAPVQPEFHYYAHESDIEYSSLNETQCEKILDTRVQAFGLNNAYNSARFVYAVEYPDVKL